MKLLPYTSIFIKDAAKAVNRIRRTNFMEDLSIMSCKQLQSRCDPRGVDSVFRQRYRQVLYGYQMDAGGFSNDLIFGKS